MTDFELDEVKDKKDRLINKLYMNKLHTLLEDDTKTLEKWRYWNKLFTKKQQEKSGWAKAKMFIDFRGKVIAHHMFDPSFDIKKFISFTKNTMKLTWKQIYWKIYAHTIIFEWKTCGKFFNGAYATHWYFHSSKPMFSFGSNKGTYQCCKQETLRFEIESKNDGWMSKEHIVKNNEELFRKLLEPSRIHFTQEPFPSFVINNETEENKKEDGSKESKKEIISINEAISKYTKESDNNWMWTGEDEDESERREKPK